MELKKSILLMYKHGYDIDFMVEDLEMKKEEIISVLRNYKKEHRGVHYKLDNELEEMLVTRLKSGITSTQISKELGITSEKVKQLAINNNIELRKSKLFNKRYIVINHKDLKVCPQCQSRKVNELKQFNDENELLIAKRVKESDQSYCMDCGTEFYIENGEMRKVLWQEIQ